MVMSREQLKLLISSFGAHLFENLADPTGTIAVLFSETLKFRDKLKDDTGEVLTVEDTRVALDALGQFLKDGQIPKSLTSEQKSLTQIWIDRLTLFN